MIKTIEHHLNESNHAHHFPDLHLILNDLCLAAKLIRKKILCAGLENDVIGSSGVVNASGEDAQALDIYSNQVVKETLLAHKRFAYLGSEEETNIITAETANNNGYVILFDPLDGSSNIDVNVSVGTIFSIYRKKEGSSSANDHCFQKGHEQVAAGYFLYGSSVMLVYSAGNGVHGFTYHPEFGEFLLSHENIKLPTDSKYYSINESLYHDCNEPTQEFIRQLKSTLSSRYVGSLVADFHRNLLKGGIYIYPGTITNPNGKLRLLYEANPLAFICEQAGGIATNGIDRILDIQPTELHQRVPLYIGSPDLVHSLKTVHKVPNLA